MNDKRLDTSIWQTPYGYRIVMRINGVLHRVRFPPTYTLKKLQEWRDDHLRLHKKTKTRGTFSADMVDYLNAVKAMPSIEDRTREIGAWEPAFGKLPRWKITPALIRTQLHAWKDAGAAASTCNHRRTALGHLFSVLDGKAQYNPVREVPPFKEPPATRRGVELHVALSAIRRVRGVTRTRLLILLWTGMRPSELMRVTAEQVDLELKMCEVHASKGGNSRLIPLNKSAVKAFKRLVRLDAFGPFSTASIRKSLVRACKKTPKLPMLRVYDLRHTYASLLRKAGADLSDVGEQLGHRSLRMTKRYAPVVLEKLRVAGDRTRNDPGRSSQPVTAGRK